MTTIHSRIHNYVYVCMYIVFHTVLHVKTMGWNTNIYGLYQAVETVYRSQFTGFS